MGNGVAQLFRKYGFAGVFIKFIEKKTDRIDQYYQTHYKEFLPTEEELEEQRLASKSFAYQPLISIVVPTYRTKERYLVELLESVMGQTYQNWQLVLADGSGDDSVKAILDAFSDDRILYRRLEVNAGISGNTNEGLKVATGEYIALLDHDDTLVPNALYEMVYAINEGMEEGTQPKLLYSDEDKISEDGTFFMRPHFKLDYSEELLRHYNAFCHLLLFHRSMLDIGMLRAEYDGAQDYDLVLRYTEALQETEIRHVAKILYHWRISETSTAGSAGSKDYAAIAFHKALQEHLARIQRCLASEEQVKYIVLLGNGVVPLDMDWDEQLSSYFKGYMHPIGMVGGRITDGPGNLAKVLFCGYEKTELGTRAEHVGLRACMRGYFDRAYLPHNVEACSLDFAIVRKDLFEQIGGVDESLAMEARNLEFGKKVRAAGYGIVIDPTVTAYKGKG